MIGIFDSGSGGLTVLRAIRDHLPSADILYFGDIKHAPYGSKSPEELSLRTLAAIRLLQGEGARSLVSACNSVSASLAVSLFDALPLSPEHLIEMVGPTVSYVRGSDARLLLCATPATVQSGIYQHAFRMVGKEVATVALPDLAGAIEFGAPREDIERIIRDGFAGIDLSPFDVLILGCTHYPLVMDAFQRVLGSSVRIFDPAIAVAERVEERFWPREAGRGRMRFLISAESEPFRAQVERLFPESQHTIEVVES